MQPTPVIAIFDIGKTNKKCFLFDRNYRVVEEVTTQFDEITDEDGFPCEDVLQLQAFVHDSLASFINKKQFKIKAVNFSGYGASFLYLDARGKVLSPLYNYLKPYPENLQRRFYDTYGGEEKISIQTASPVLGNLNSGMQLYRIKYERPDLFANIRYALHLPQYLSFLITGKYASDVTSIGCHTQLWNFETNNYHEWVMQEGIVPKLAPIVDSSSGSQVAMLGHQFFAGVGMHDSSAALIPYLIQLQDPFLLISTGTWSISLNPFNHAPLSIEELRNDCLCYLSYKGLPVKASRLFAGFEHETQAGRIADHFNQQQLKYKSVVYNRNLMQVPPDDNNKFRNRDLDDFNSYEEAYHWMVFDLVQDQFISSNRILNNNLVKRIFVDGGFSKNTVYMHLLANAFPEKELFAAGMSQATALGAAMAIHPKWNDQPCPSNLIELKHYAASPI